ncbi:hypothetical protein GF327_03105 [Candidatus Woesearchaeota archaeon]|nr:hypothetical protein [Candidatus Woesearchaeota archaeon]
MALEYYEILLKKHTDYLVVSGYVSISTGRTRGTENIDIICPIIDKIKFQELFSDLDNNKFWCYQGDKAQEVYNQYFSSLTTIRFAKENQIFPNIKLIPFKKTDKIKSFEFNHPQKIIIEDFEFKIPQIEFEIAYKEKVLKGKKDISDAKHLRIFFSDIIKEYKIKKFKKLIQTES